MFRVSVTNISNSQRDLGLLYAVNDSVAIVNAADSVNDQEYDIYEFFIAILLGVTDTDFAHFNSTIEKAGTN